MAAPAVSVSTVRVSLMVTIAQRTDRGACCLCSTWLTGASGILRPTKLDLASRRASEAQVLDVQPDHETTGIAIAGLGGDERRQAPRGKLVVSFGFGARP